ncbi:MAG: hypothetical protein FWH27_13140 [Planctomycetaceae bacterium]|nr:hypothetical protein [Planctomycetaceae bacterium]
MTVRPLSSCVTLCVSILLFVSAIAFLQTAKGFADEPLQPFAATTVPEAVPHFPDRLHTFVWRNWNLVPLERLALVLQTSPENVAQIADSLGLPEYQKPVWATEQIYITLIRRNWHLLPYEQILELVEMTPQRLAFALQEDDFLWVKLGTVKPKCEPLYYQAPNAAARKRAEAIREILHKTVGTPLVGKDVAPRFAFIEDLKTAQNYSVTPPSGSKSLRYIYSYFALYGDPLSSDDAEVFPDGLLEKLSRLDVNGVWLHTVLREMAPGGEKFPEFGHGCEKRMENLRKLVERAKRYHIDIYLYMNEPRTMPNAFFQRSDIPGRDKTAGVPVGNYTALCISNPDVQNWIKDSLTYIFTEVPSLGGVFTISGSENHTHCNSHGAWQNCPQCKSKTGAEVTALANALVEEGVHRAAPDAKVIVWDWGWNGHGIATDVIEKLPANIWLQSVSEWALPIERGGIRGTVGEYSISSVGPGPRAKQHWKEAKDRGLKAVAKVQLNCTWEIAAVPYVPVMDLIAEHCSNLAACDIDGMLMSWTLGGYPSPNLEIPKLFDRTPVPPQETVLDELAEERYGSAGAPLARKAWTLMSNAYREYPYSGGVVYCAPVQMGPANLFRPTPTGYRATMVGIPYDDLGAWRGHYPPEIFAAQFKKVSMGFAEGIEQLARAVELAPKPHNYDIEAELRYAKVVRIHFESVANQVHYVLLRDENARPETPIARKAEIRNQTRQLLESEIALTKELYQLTLEDSSIGFESTNQYFYVPNDLLEKLISCRRILESVQSQ